MKHFTLIFTEKVRLFVSILLFFITTSAAWAAWTSTPITPDASGVYHVTAAGQLAWIATQTNGGNTFAGKTIVLDNDIDLQSQAWTPIGTSSKPFQGSFDGGSKTISNLKVNTSWTNKWAGLFGYIQNPSIIKNVLLSGISILGNYNNSIGGLVGEADGNGTSNPTTITNCSVSGNINISSYSPCGGLIGYTSDQVNISQCSSSVSINTFYVGGLIGKMSNGSASVTNSFCSGNIIGSNNYAGGLIGLVENAVSITGCYTTGTLSGTGYNFGGLIGSITSNSASIFNCFSTGNVSTTGNTVGGFIGNIAGSINIADCYSMGKVSGTNTGTGGFVGVISSSPIIVNCYATGVVFCSANIIGGFAGNAGSAKIANCYAAGNVSGGSSNMGGFVGTGGGTFTNCYFDTQGTGTTISGASSGVLGVLSSVLTSTSPGLTNGSPYGTTNKIWDFSSGYYPQLYNLKNGNSSSYSITSPASITVPAYTVTTDAQAWSALSVVPLNLAATSETTANVNLNFTAPMTSASNSNKSLTWQGASGILEFENNNNGDIYLTASGTATFTTTDADGRIKTFYAVINASNFNRYFVNISGGSDSNYGTSWSTAYKSLQKAIDQCTDLTKTVQIWVAKGTYTPSEDAVGNVTTGTASTSTFILQKNVSIYGGFTGDASTETPSGSLAATTILNKRDLKRNSTILSGNSKSISVVSYNSGDGDWSKATLDGVTISGGITGTATVASKNLALNKPVTTTSGTSSASSAVDGNTSTQWTSDNDTPESLSVDLGSIQSINRIKINWDSPNYAINFQVLVSNDASTWSSVQSITSNSLTTNDLTGLNITGRYIKINCTYQNGFYFLGFAFWVYPFSINELEVYGTLTVANYAANIPAGATLQNCKITSNTCSALNLNTGASAYNVLIADNGTGTTGDGVTMDGNATLVNATVVNNKGAGINSASTSSTVKNTILWGNGSNTTSTTAPIMSNCAASSNYGATAWPFSTGSNNIELYHRSPNFKDVANKNYELLLISPCLGNGSTSANSLAIDANGGVRTYNSTIDMGAFQKWDGYIANGTNISPFRNSNSITISDFATNIATSSNQANVELQVPSGVTLNMANKTLNTNYLEIVDNNTTDNTKAPVIRNGTLNAAKAMYVRTASLFRSDNKTGASTFFSLPFKTKVLTNSWPVNPSIDGGILQSTVQINKYDEPTRAANGTNKSAWVAITNASNEILNPGKGYAIVFNKLKVPNNNSIATTIIFMSDGAVTLGNTTSSTTSLSYTSGYTASNSGWNLIGNPFAQIANITNGDPSNWPYGNNTDVVSYAGGVYTYNSGNDTYTVTPLANLNPAGLSPYGAYFIKTDGTHTPNQVQLTAVNSGSGPLRVKSAVSAVSETTATPSMLRFQLDDGSISTNSYVIFSDDAHAEMLDVEDSPNMSAVTNGYSLVMNTFATGSSTALGINALPFTGTTMEIPLQVSVPKAGSYTISLPESDTSTMVYLKDASGNLTDLTNGSYSLSVNDASAPINYTIVFSRVATALPQSKTDELTVIQDHAHITISSPDAIQRINIYGVNGQLYRQLEVNEFETKFDLPSTNGVYLIKAVTTKGAFTRKIVSH